MIVTNSKTPTGARRNGLNFSGPGAARGFTFIEVLFSVIILGVGLIMVAAMLPVAIKQSDDTLSEITGKATAESGFGYVRAAATSDNLVATVDLPNTNRPAMVWTTSYGTNNGHLAAGISPVGVTPLFQVNNPEGLIRGNQVNTIDGRFAWVPFYLRKENDPTATVWCIGVRLRNTELIPGGVYPTKTWSRAVNGPWLVRAYINDATDGSPDRIRFQQHDPADGTSAYPGAAAPGAFVILNEFLDPDSSVPVPQRFQATTAMTSDAQLAPRYGRLLRLGSSLSADEFELDPAYDIPMLRGPDHVLNTPDDVGDTNFSSEREVAVWIIGVGRNYVYQGLGNVGLAPDDVATNPFVGPAQDVVIVSGQITVK